MQKYWLGKSASTRPLIPQAYNMTDIARMTNENATHRPCRKLHDIFLLSRYICSTPENSKAKERQCDIIGIVQMPCRLRMANRTVARIIWETPVMTTPQRFFQPYSLTKAQMVTIYYVRSVGPNARNGRSFHTSTVIPSASKRTFKDSAIQSEITPFVRRDSYTAKETVRAIVVMKNRDIAQVKQENFPCTCHNWARCKALLTATPAYTKAISSAVLAVILMT